MRRRSATACSIALRSRSENLVNVSSFQNPSANGICDPHATDFLDGFYAIHPGQFDVRNDSYSGTRGERAECLLGIAHATNLKGPLAQHR